MKLNLISALSFLFFSIFSYQTYSEVVRFVEASGSGVSSSFNGSLLAAKKKTIENAKNQCRGAVSRSSFWETSTSIQSSGGRGDCAYCASPLGKDSYVKVTAKAMFACLL